MFYFEKYEWASTTLMSRVTFREKCMSLSEDDVIQVKEAFKWVMQGLIAKELGGVAVVTKVKRKNIPSCFGL